MVPTLRSNDLCQVGVTKGKGGLRATGSLFGESGEQNLRVKGTVDRMPVLLVIG